jgi:hypothetical protein
MTKPTWPDRTIAALPGRRLRAVQDLEVDQAVKIRAEVAEVLPTTNDQRTFRRAPPAVRLRVWQSFVEARQAVIADVLPSRRVGDELVSRRPHAGVSVDRCHPHYRDFSGLGIAGEQV